MVRPVATLFLLGLLGCNTDYDLNFDKGDEEGPDAPGPGLDTGPSGTGPEDTGGGTTGDNDGVDVNLQDPIAVCSVSPGEVRPLVEDATWIGGDSYDPEGGTITQYTWSLVSKPTGSGINMPGGASANRTGFVADLAGEYVGQLVVRTDDGRVSEPCQTTLTAVPVENLWVEMYWEYSDDDMDLHLVRPGGTLQGNGDCYYGNTNPDWGVFGDSTDDPSLDLDDISGTGPENINIEYPENGIFTVYVHDFTYSTGDSPSSNLATVNIYIGGSLEWTGQYNFRASDEGQYIPYATINWPAGTVSSLL